MITHLAVKNYRVLRDLQMDLAPLTVLVGPNGVGKSTTLEVLHYIVLLTQGQNPMDREPWIQALAQPKEALLEINAGGLVVRQTHWNPALSRPNVIFRIQGQDLNPGQANLPQLGSDQWPIELPAVVLRLRLDPKVLRGDSQGNLPIGQIGSDGQGLAAALNDLKTNDDPRFDTILEAMRKIVPGLKGIKAPRVPNNNQFTILCATQAKSEIPAKFMSDGTLYALALITALSTNPEKPTLVLLDDIDQGLHPKAQADLIHQIRIIQKFNPNLQIIATCHSPYLVDSLNGNEVVLMHADADGFAQAKRLSDHPDYERLKGALGSGEFWGSVGEEWVTSTTVPTAGAP